MYAQVLPVDPGETRCQVTGVPIGAIRFDLAAQTLLHIGEWIIVRLQNLSQQGYVGNGQTQCVDLAEALLVRECGHMNP